MKDKPFRTKRKEKALSLKERISEGLHCAPAMARKPFIVLHWLISARAAQAAVIIILLTVPTVLTWGMDKILSALYPPITEKILFDYVQRVKEDPRLEEKKHMGRTLLWVASAGWVAFLFILHIPAAIHRAEEDSLRYEREGDTCADDDLNESLYCYQKALDLTIENAHISRIEEKIGSIAQKSAAHASERAVPKDISAENTEIIPTSHSGSEGTIVSQKGRKISYIGSQNRYHLEGVMGRGATGVVHRAHDKTLERDVTIKELHTILAHDADLVSRFRQEAKVLARLTHPNIVQVYDFIEEADRVWIVMELVDGGELDNLLRDKGQGRLTVRETARFGVPCAEAMAYAHSLGVIHRDFKPSNVLLTGEGTLKITDFGLAKLSRSAHHTQAGTILGSPAYMSPEQADGRVADSRSDIYSLGVVLYRMLAGKVPFEGDIPSVIAQHISKQPVPPRRIRASIPKEINDLILSMLEKDPDHRIQDLKTVAQVLGKYLEAS